MAKCKACDGTGKELIETEDPHRFLVDDCSVCGGTREVPDPEEDDQ